MVTLAGNTGLPQAWGVVCAPDHEVLRGRHGDSYLVAAEDDPLTGNILSVGRGGKTYVVDPDGSGAAMTFRTGNEALVPTKGFGDPISGTAPCPGNPNQTCNHSDVRSIAAYPAGFDASGRAWMVLNQAEPSQPDGFQPPFTVTPMDVREKWLVSVDTTRLLGRQAHRLPATVGESTFVQAERTQTTAAQQRAGSVALEEAVSAINPVLCLDYPPWLGMCAYPWNTSAPTRGGLALGAVEAWGGVPDGTVARYTVVVPKGGSFEVTYRASDINDDPPHDVVTDERIQLRVVGGTTYPATPIARSIWMHNETGPTIELGPGTHEIEVFAPAGHHDWQLDWIRFTRT